MMAPTMKIDRARVIARFLSFLYRLKIISAARCDTLIDYLTVKSLEEELSKYFDKLSTKDSNDKPNSEDK